MKDCLFAFSSTGRFHIILEFQFITYFPVLNHVDATFKIRTFRKLGGGYLNYSKKRKNVKSNAKTREQKKHNKYKKTVNLGKKPKAKEKNQNWVRLIFLKGNN